MGKGCLGCVLSVGENRKEKGVRSNRIVALSLHKKADGKLDASHTLFVAHGENIIHLNDPNSSCLETSPFVLGLQPCLQAEG